MYNEERRDDLLNKITDELKMLLEDDANALDEGLTELAFLFGEYLRLIANMLTKLSTFLLVSKP